MRLSTSGRSETTPADAHFTEVDPNSMARESGLSHTTMTKPDMGGLRALRAATARRPSSSPVVCPLFVDKVRDIIGLYRLAAGPARWIWLCVDDKEPDPARWTGSQPVEADAAGHLVHERRITGRATSVTAPPRCSQPSNVAHIRLRHRQVLQSALPGQGVRIDFSEGGIDRRRPRGAGRPHRHGQLYVHPARPRRSRPRLIAASALACVSLQRSGGATCRPCARGRRVQAANAWFAETDCAAQDHAAAIGASSARPASVEA